MRIKLIVFMFILVLACGQSRPATPEPSEPLPAVEATEAPDPTPIPEPPTPIPELPTPTPEPTATPAPAYPEFEPISLSGSGDSVQDIAKPEGPALLRVSGNSEARFFAIIALDAAGQQVDLLVNTTNPYEGVRPLDLQGSQTTRLQIQATGNWTAELFPVTQAPVINVPGALSGQGDIVLRLAGAIPDIANIRGNESARFFAVIGYGSGFPDLLVNTTDVYEGQVVIRSGVNLLMVQATGPWNVEITGK